MSELDRIDEVTIDESQSTASADRKQKHLKPAFKNKDIKTEKQAIKALRPKRKSLPAKTIKILISVAASFVAAVLVVTLCCIYLIKPVNNYQFAFKNVHNFVALSVPMMKTKAIDIPDGTAAEKIIYLYKKSNEICKASNSVTAYNKGVIQITVGNSENFMNVDTVVMKSQSEYFKCEHHVKADFPLADMPIIGKIFLARGGICSVRTYCQAGDEVARTQKVTNANELDEEGLPSADWSVATESTTSVPVFNDSQEGNFGLFNHTIEVEYIKNCSFELFMNEETKEEYYIVTFDLDVDQPEATAISRQEIIEGTGDKNTAYSSVQFGATFWKDGSIRTLTCIENWFADFKITQGLFEMQYNWHFSYDPIDCDIGNYPEAAGIAY